MVKTLSFFISCFFLLQSASAHPSWGICVDKKGNIYFADISHNQRGSVWKFTNDGKLELLLSDFHAHNVSLDEDDNLITAHGEDEHVMIRLKPDGAKDTLYYTRDWDVFFGGNCTFSKQGNIFFGIKNLIWKIDQQGKKTQFNTKKLEWNQTVYVDSEENIYVPDIGVNNGTIFKLGNNGKVDTIATDLISRLERPKDKHADVLLGITKDHDDNIYVAETAGRRIIKISDDGGKETFYKAPTHWMPTGIYFSSREAFILEYGSQKGAKGPRIIKVDPAGTQKELFNYDIYPTKEGLIIRTNTTKTKAGLLPIILSFLAVIIVAWVYFKNKRKRTLRT